MFELRFYFDSSAWLPIYCKTREDAIEKLHNYQQLFEADELNKEMVYVNKASVWFITIVDKNLAPKEEFQEPITP